jgi:deoxyribonuclease IV
MSYDPRFRFGAHMPATGGLHNAFAAGRQAGCDVVQIFTKSPQQWKAKELTDDHVEAFLAAQDESGIPCVAAHDTYLINPCAEDPEILRRSRDALADEMDRSSRLGIPYVVMHVGTQGGAPEEEASCRLVDTVRRALDQRPDGGSMLLLETMAGQGKCLGHRFEHLARALEALDREDRVGVCLDTCHIFAAGYDIRDPESYAATIDAFDRAVGLRRLKLIHANDSKRELGSRVDRHEHIGQGHIGLDAFRLLLTDPRLQSVPVILETPKEGDMDPVNLAALRSAAGLA